MMNIWEAFVNFIEVLLFYIYISNKLHPNTKIKHLKGKQFFYLLIRFFALCVLNQLNISSLITLCISCFWEVTFAVFFYQDKLSSKMFFGIFYTAICMIAEFIPFFCITAFSPKSSTALLQQGTLRIPITTLYLALIAVLVYLFRFLFNKYTLWTISQKIVYATISILGIAIGHYILLTTIAAEELINKYIAFRLTLINLFFLLLFVALLVCIYQLGVSGFHNHGLIEAQKQHELEKQEYQNLMESTSALREMKHDIEIHLNTIQMLASKNDLQKLQNYIDCYLHSLNHINQFVTTGNTAIDCILSSKLAKSKESGISTEFSVLLPDHFVMDTILFCSLLGNLWNNAIEANVRMLEGNCGMTSFIKFYIKPFHDMTIIHIENSYDGKLIYSPKGTLISTKSKKEHGIGMKRITDIVVQEKGLLQINTADNVFSVHILLPQKEQTHENDNYNT